MDWEQTNTSDLISKVVKFGKATGAVVLSLFIIAAIVGLISKPAGTNIVEAASMIFESVTKKMKDMAQRITSMKSVNIEKSEPTDSMDISFDMFKI